MDKKMWFTPVWYEQLGWFSDSLMSELQALVTSFFHVWENYPYVTLLTMRASTEKRDVSISTNQG